MMGKQGFIGRDNILARRERCLGCVFCGAIMASHQFDKNVDILALGQRNRVAFPRIAIERDSSFFGAAACRDRAQCDGTTSALLKQRGLLADDFHNAGAHGSQSCYPQT